MLKSDISAIACAKIINSRAIECAPLAPASHLYSSHGGKQTDKGIKLRICLMIVGFCFYNLSLLMRYGWTELQNIPFEGCR